MSPGNTIFVVAATASALAATFLPASHVQETESPDRKLIEIGEVVPEAKLHIVSHPGRYGLGPELPGSTYAVFERHLIRVDTDTGRVQSVIREVTGIVD